MLVHCLVVVLTMSRHAISWPSHHGCLLANVGGAASCETVRCLHSTVIYSTPSYGFPLRLLGCKDSCSIVLAVAASERGWSLQCLMISVQSLIVKRHVGSLGASSNRNGGLCGSSLVQPDGMARVCILLFAFAKCCVCCQHSFIGRSIIIGPTAHQLVA